MFEGKFLWLMLFFVAITLAMRIRRDLGFQKVSSFRVKMRMVGLGLISLMITSLLLGLNPGLALLTWAISLSLLTLSLRMTVYEHRADGIWFRPNAWIGGALVILFLGRIGYRLIQISKIGGLDAMVADQSLASEHGIPGLGRSPLSLMVLLLLLSYYSMYYLMVSKRAAALKKTMPVVTDES